LSYGSASPSIVLDLPLSVELRPGKPDATGRRPSRISRSGVRTLPRKARRDRGRSSLQAGSGSLRGAELLQRRPSADCSRVSGRSPRV